MSAFTNRCEHCGLSDGLHDSPECPGLRRPCVMQTVDMKTGQTTRCESPRGWDAVYHELRNFHRVYSIVDRPDGAWCRRHALQIVALLNGENTRQRERGLARLLEEIKQTGRPDLLFNSILRLDDEQKKQAS